MADPLLIVEGLRIAYGGIQAVKGITFHVDEGEMVALIGANGAGKTSCLKALARQLDAAGGSVRYAGKEIAHLAPLDVRDGEVLRGLHLERSSVSAGDDQFVFSSVCFWSLGLCRHFGPPRCCSTGSRRCWSA